LNEVVILARLSGIFLNIFLLLFLITQPGTAAPAQKKAGSSATSAKTDNAASKSKPESAEKK